MIHEKPQITQEDFCYDNQSDTSSVISDVSHANCQNGIQMVYKNPTKNPKNYACYNCDFFTSNKKDYARHLATAKHNNGIQVVHEKPQKTQITDDEDTEEEYKCICGNIYKYRSGLYRHRKSCNKEIKIKDIDKSLLTTQGQECVEMLLNKDLMLQLLKQNCDLQSAFIELTKEKQSNAISSNSVNSLNGNSFMNSVDNSSNTTNNSFNLQFYLNETCKNALNINEFIDNIVITLEDLEQTGLLGYAEGVSRIFIKNLQNTSDDLWPIHCSDLKRQVIYIKCDGVWNKETNEKLILIKAIKRLANKNMIKINDWKKKYPGCDQADSRKNDMYLKIMMNSMCGGSKEETDSNMNKIVNNIAKHAVIIKQ